MFLLHFVSETHRPVITPAVNLRGAGNILGLIYITIQKDSLKWLWTNYPPAITNTVVNRYGNLRPVRVLLFRKVSVH